MYFLGAQTGLPEGHVDGLGRPDSADTARKINETAYSVAICNSPNITTLITPALINSDTQFRFEIAGPNNGTYTVEYTLDYLTWSTLGTYVLSSGSVTVTDNIGSDAARFYRAKLGSSYLSTQVGYAKVSAPAGQSMIANQLETDDNRLATLLPSVPVDTQFWKFDEGTQQWVYSTYRAGTGWSANMTMNPSEGGILKNFSGQPISLKFVGEVQSSFWHRIPPSCAIRSPPVPQAGPLTSRLAFQPLVHNDQAQKMTGVTGTYTTYTWNSGGYWTPQEPTIGLGESFWVYTQSTYQDVVWSRIFWTWP